MWTYAGPNRTDPIAQDDGQTIFTMIAKVEDHGSGLRFWVELRGFEPLTPSMRTRMKSSQGRACRTGRGSRSTREGRCPDTMAFSADPPRRVPGSGVLSRQRMANK